MAKKTINMKLNTSSVRKAINYLRDYQKSVDVKVSRALEILLQHGYDVAIIHVGENEDFSGYIALEKTVTSAEGGPVGLLVMTDTPITVEWETKAGLRSVEVSPMLMEEFGSGQYAEVLQASAKSLGVGRGTFPGQTHAFQNIWFWRDEEGNLNSSKGVKPTHPMYNAAMQIYADYKSVFREVFAEG